MIRVFIVDDHELVRIGLKHLLDAPDIDVVGEAVNVTHAIEASLRLRPDVVLCDYHLPDGNGLRVVQSLLQQDPTIRVLMVTMIEDPQVSKQLLSAGAWGFVNKNTGEAVIRAVRQVAEGRRFDEAVPTPKASAFDRLSERELEVVHLLISGHTNKSTAQRLNLTVNSVRTYRERAFAKLEVNSHLELMELAREAGLG
ncbi:response regulator [Lysobacter sp. CA199]|uniref:response regulator n=1 Tax=Lysobacter sp. CA199 TaxID=3455608 RepID=UPI003F8D5806